MSGRKAATANQNGVSKGTRRPVSVRTTSAEPVIFTSSLSGARSSPGSTGSLGSIQPAASSTVMNVGSTIAGIPFFPGRRGTNSASETVALVNIGRPAADREAQLMFRSGRLLCRGRRARLGCRRVSAGRCCNPAKRRSAKHGGSDRDQGSLAVSRCAVSQLPAGGAAPTGIGSKRGRARPDCVRAQARSEA